MGSGIVSAEVDLSVKGLNAMFGSGVATTRTNFGHVQKAYPKLLTGDGSRQGTLWFAASVLMPDVDLAGHPSPAFRRWLRWLIWFEKVHGAEAGAVRNVINLALASNDAKATISWTWTENPSAFSATALGHDGANANQTNF